MSDWKDSFIRDIYELYYAPPMMVAPSTPADKEHVCNSLLGILKLYSENLKELDTCSLSAGGGR